MITSPRPGKNTFTILSSEEIAHSFGESQSNSELLFLAGNAVKALDDYNQHAIGHFEHRKLEFATMIKMLMETVGSISSIGVENIGRLQQIEQLVTSARELSDVKVITMRLGDCLDGIRSEVDRQRVETERTMQALLGEIEKRQMAAGGSAPVDLTTSLPPPRSG